MRKLERGPRRKHGGRPQRIGKAHRPIHVLAAEGSGVAKRR